MMPWQAPTIAVKWGPYFPPDPEEESKIVSTVQEALGSKNGTPIIQLRHAVEKIAPYFGIENIDAALEGLEAEQVERDKKALETTKLTLDAEAKAKQGAPPGEEPKPKPPPTIP